MNNYYLLIYLTQELKNKLLAASLQKVITPYRDTIEFYLDKEDEQFRLIFSTHPNFNSLFWDQYRPAKKSNTISFFGALQGEEIIDVSLTENDRFITIHFQNGFQLIFKLFGHKSNVLLANDGMIIDAFKQKDVEVGKAIPEPKQVDFFRIRNESSSTKDKIIQLNPILPRTIIDRLIAQHDLEEKTDEDLTSFIKELSDEIKNSKQFRVFENYDITPASGQFLSGNEIKSFASVNDAIRFAYRNKSKENRIGDEIDQFKNDLKRKLKRERGTFKNLQKAVENPDRAEEFEKFGHLLMSNAHRSFESEFLEVEDFYNEGVAVKIPMKQGKSIAENAELYYSKSRNAKESFEESKVKLPAVEKEIELLEAMLSELDSIDSFRELDDWKARHKDKISTESIGSKEQAQSDPYRKVMFDGYEIWIGKHAKSNDKIVQLSHKEDIWLHARGVGGSHVLIRNRNNKDFPPKDVIEKAASYAAFLSKLKGSDLVPVIYTKRKFVRKPKGGAAGLVKVDKEEVMIVNPEKPNE